MSDRRDSDDSALADALEDFHRRRGRGEPAEVDDYRSTLGDSHVSFEAIVQAERLLDEVLSPASFPEALPRPFGPYTLLRELGRGAAGVVYEAVHRDLGRKVAIKVLRTGFDTDATARERFRREARACAHVRHDGIVAIYEAGEVDGRPFYAMDYVPGETLAHCVRAKRLPTPESLAAGLSGVADALQALHDAGIVHRDVKPSNVMVRPDGRMILCDFGLARSAETATLTKTGDALGTPLYMSPEQILGQRAAVDARTDVYQVGATFYEALVGRPVFEAEEMPALMKLIATERPVPPREANAAIPEACENIALKCLEKDKSDRYPTAAALAEDLRAFAAGRRVSGRPVAPVVRALRVVRRRWIPIAATLALAAGLGVWWTTRGTKVAFVPEFPEQASVAIKIDGVSVGSAAGSPLEVAVEPGRHWAQYTGPATFQGSAEWITLGKGERVVRPIVLFPKGGIHGENRESWVAYVAYLKKQGVDIGIPDLDAMAERGRRPPSGLALRVFYPKGDVRLSDLDAGFGETTQEAVLPPGRIVFERDGRELASIEPIDTSPRNLRITIPDSVRRALRTGDFVTWGWKPSNPTTLPKGVSLSTATFKVVSDAPALATDLASSDRSKPGFVHDLLRVQVLHKHGLDTAAFREAYALAKAHPGEDPYWRVMLTILESLRVDEPLGSWFVGDVETYVGSGSRGEPPTLEPKTADTPPR